MKRISYHLTIKQIDELKKVSKDTGLSVADLIRRAIDAFLKKNK